MADKKKKKKRGGRLEDTAANIGRVAGQLPGLIGGVKPKVPPGLRKAKVIKRKKKKK